MATRPPLVIGVLVQARMSSRRLPGKALRPLAGRPLLGWVLDRLTDADGVDLVAVTTSATPDDDAIAAFCAAEDLLCYRGGLEDVLGRMRDAACHFGLDAIARVSGDSPLIDPALVSLAVAVFRSGGVDIVTNVFPRSYPPGQSVEVVSSRALEAAHAEPLSAADREHVTPWFYRQPHRWRITNLSAPTRMDDVVMTVDTEADAGRIEAAMTAMTGPVATYGVEQLVGLFRSLAT